MGWFQHHVIIVYTDFAYEDLARAHQKAFELFDIQVSMIVPSQVNHGQSFYVGPDGSKRGWDEAKKGDYNRAEYIRFLRTFQYGGSSPLHWAEVRILDEGDGMPKVVNSAQHDRHEHYKPQIGED